MNTPNVSKPPPAQRGIVEGPWQGITAVTMPYGLGSNLPFLLQLKFDLQVNPCKVREIYKELLKIPLDQWARAYCEMNSWCWPSELIHLRPHWWDSDNKQRMSKMLNPYMEAIKFHIGEYAISKYHNRERMTEESHKSWYMENIMEISYLKL